jgi:hypothetical protein
MAVQTNFRAVDMPGTTKPVVEAAKAAPKAAAPKVTKASTPKVEEVVAEVVVAVEEEKSAE